MNRHHNQVVANMVPPLAVLGMSLDVQNPDLSIHAPVPLTGDNVVHYPLSGTCTEEAEIKVHVAKLASTVITPCLDGFWDTALDMSSLLPGEISLRVWPVDRAGNQGGAQSIRIVKKALHRTMLLETLATGSAHNCAIVSGGGVQCWGEGSRWRLGHHSEESSNYPVAVHANSTGSALLGDAIQISVADEHSCALTSNGKVWCWGTGDSGRLGNGSYQDHPYALPIDMVPVVQIALRGAGSCALSEAGRVLCWGKGASPTHSPQSPPARL